MTGFIFAFKRLLFILISFVFSYQSVLASESEIDCKKCHQQVYDEIAASAFQHADIVLKECAGCHLSSSGTKKDGWVKIPIANYAKEYLITISNLLKDSTYNVKINLKNKENKEKASDIISFTPDSVSEFWVDDEIVPTVSNVKISRVDISALASSEISWETDELSDSGVDYWISKDQIYSASSNLYTKMHNIKLSGLSHKNVYNYRVISSDPFGNKTVSGDYKFDTSKAFNNKSDTVKYKKDEVKFDFETVNILKFKYKEKGLKSDKNMEAFKNIVAIYFSMSDEANAIVEYMEKKGEGDSIPEEKKHGRNGLKSQIEIGINTCVERCHKRDVSHPVDVAVKRNMQVPEEIPTAKGNIITCITCHTPHGSKLQYLARVDFNTLCVMCHTKRL